jgi:hypothetical protein
MTQSTLLYLVGFILAVIGLAWCGHLAGIPSQWIGAGVVVLIGLGIAGAAKKFGSREPGPPPKT